MTHPLLRAHLLELISTRTPLAGSDAKLVEGGTERLIFQPALPLRGVTEGSPGYMSPLLFQPALPLRGVTSASTSKFILNLFQPALPLRGVTRGTVYGLSAYEISTRTPLAGSDRHLPPAVETGAISTRTPLAGSDQALNLAQSQANQFQPALPLRGVTPSTIPPYSVPGYFNPHSPCGE